MAYKIYGEDNDVMLEISVDGWRVFGCTLAPVAQESHEWLAGHLDNAFQVASKLAATKAVAQHQDALLKMLGAPVPHRNF